MQFEQQRKADLHQSRIRIAEESAIAAKKQVKQSNRRDSDSQYTNYDDTRDSWKGTCTHVHVTIFIIISRYMYMHTPD